MPAIIPRRLHPLLWRMAGAIAMAVGTVGIVLPVLPTVPFYILAAFCFGKSSPVLEARILAHPVYGPHIRAWRERRAISRWGKIAAVLALTGSAIGSLLLVEAEPWRYLPLVIALVVGPWIATRATA